MTFLCIHPFWDGNGRMSRLLTTLLLYRNGFCVGKYISLEAQISKHKDLYYNALSASQQDWHEGKEDATPFIKYILQTIFAAYVDFEERVDLVCDKKSALEIVRSAVEKKIGKFSKSDLMALCPSISASSVEKSLNELITQGLLQKHGSGRSTFYTRTI